MKVWWFSEETTRPCDIGVYQRLMLVDNGDTIAYIVLFNAIICPTMPMLYNVHIWYYDFIYCICKQLHNLILHQTSATSHCPDSLFRVWRLFRRPFEWITRIVQRDMRADRCSRGMAVDPTCVMVVCVLVNPCWELQPHSSSPFNTTLSVESFQAPNTNLFRAGESYWISLRRS